jgi:LysR family transcriptional regulator for bpeEF and oprC
MDLSGIVAFVRAAQARSFVGAAATLGITPSGVSKAVSRLEDRVGARLLNRTTRRVTLTPDGEEFFERCRQALADLEEAEGVLSLGRGQPRGRLKVNLPVSLGRLFIVPALPALLRGHPLLELEASLTDRLVDVVDEGFDAVVRISELRDSSLIARKIWQTRMVVCGSPAYLAAREKPAHPDDLAAHDRVQFLYPGSGRPYHWRFCGPDGRGFELPASGRLSLNSGEAMVEAAVAGSGLIQVNDFLAVHAIEAGRLRPVLLDWLADGPPIHVLYPRPRRHSAKVQTFVDFIAGLADRFRLPLPALPDEGGSAPPPGKTGLV